MASVNLADADSTAPAPIHPSPIRPTTHEGSQTPPPDDGATAYDSSPPLPERIRPRQGSLARKRTIEEMYEKNEAPKTSPRAAKHLQRSATIAINPESRGQHLRSNPFGPSTENAHTSFTKEIQDYKEQLDQEFQNFEQSLADRDPSADLEDLDWDSFEEQYNQEIHACNTAEREIMDEFNARFAQFMLYMQVSSDHEAERAIKRLRTRIAVARNSEEALVEKQAHHNKVLEAFRSAMALLGNV